MRQVKGEKRDETNRESREMRQIDGGKRDETNRQREKR